MLSFLPPTTTVRLLLLLLQYSTSTCSAAVATVASSLMRQLFLDLGNGLARVQVFGTDLGTVHNGMTTVQFEGIIEFGQTLAGAGVARVLDPSVGLHQDGRAQVLVGRPPVGRTGGGATGAEDAFVHAIQLGPVLTRLQVLALATVRLGTAVRGLQPRFDGSVLFVKVAHIGDQILNDVHVRQRVNLGGHLGVIVNVGQAGQGVGTVNVHGTRSTNALATRPTKGQGGILFILDFNEGIQHHRSALGQVDGVGGKVRSLVGLFRIPTVDFEVLDFFLRLDGSGRHFLFQLGFGGSSRRKRGSGGGWQLISNRSLCVCCK
jgi:hypothetical protein